MGISSLADALQADLATLARGPLAPVAVAVLDTGIDATHPDLAGRVSEAFEIARDGERFRAAAAALASANDLDGHGTAVASVAAAVAPNACIADIRVIGGDDTETAEAVVEGLRLAVLRRFPVVNLSLACDDRLLVEVMRLCEQAYWQGQIVVAARRNTPLLEHGIPAQLSACLGVDSGRFDSAFEFEFRDRHPVELAAHGDEVRVATPGGGHETRTGTSYAAPAVAGLCAILLGAFPDLTPFEVRSVLRASALRVERR